MLVCFLRNKLKRSQSQLFLCFKYKNKFKIFKYLHQFLNILRNTYSMVPLIPQMKSGTPKKYTLIPYTGQLNNSVMRLMNWYCVYCHHLGFYPWNPQIQTDLKNNDSATAEDFKTKHFA